MSAAGNDRNEVVGIAGTATVGTTTSASSGTSNSTEMFSSHTGTLLTADLKNKTFVVCERCGSKVLKPGSATIIYITFDLPHMKKKSDRQKPGDTEQLTEFWLVTDMYTFENVGFCNAVGNIKYLTCADCEVGPIGYHDVTDKTKYYVALDRVVHEH